MSRRDRIIQFSQPRRQDCYFLAQCPVCGHQLRLRYVYYSEDGVAEDPEIVDAGVCGCLLGQNWLEDALDDYLDRKYTQDVDDIGDAR